MSGSINNALLVGALVLLISVVAVRLSARAGLPSLLVYLLLGVAIGEAGLGIQFSHWEVTRAVGRSGGRVGHQRRPGRAPRGRAVGAGRARTRRPLVGASPFDRVRAGGGRPDRTGRRFPGRDRPAPVRAAGGRALPAGDG